MATAYRPAGKKAAAARIVGLAAPPGSSSNDPTLEIARRLYRDRRLRAEHFKADIFGEPAWDMLLDLFIAAGERRQVSTSAACTGASVPAATGLRWIHGLEAKGLVGRTVDHRDARRVWVSLTTAGRRAMVAYLARLMQSADA